MTADNTEMRFEFGDNWKDFIGSNFSIERVEISKKHMLDFIGCCDFSGRDFLDIGCGSGLHSMAALISGATRVHSFDCDPNSIAASNLIREKIGNPSNWTTEQGSVLDDAFMASLPQFQIVYAWGVLHHTGDVWHAIRNAAGRVAPGGLFYIALYSADVQKDPKPEFWLDVKRKYVAGGSFTRRMMELWYIWRFMMARQPSRLSSVLNTMRQYKKNRGMNMMTDIRDWLGGWPMEFVYDKDANDFVTKMGFELKNIATGEANTEFLFLRTAAV
jgi:2-polyprenyl-6-hydroxyphenyl methylase/3-demethylubiquinone-9 3-methyltransferase